MVIHIKSIINYCDTYEDGQIVYKNIQFVLKNHEKLILSFKGINAISSSFINGAFIPLVNILGLDKFKQKIQIIDSNKTMNRLIVDRLNNENGKNAEAASHELCLR
jgi:hypothetical protein